MSKIGRNDPCPCGSGKKFKNCHIGREEELVLERLEGLPEGAAEKIVALPEVQFGRCREILTGLDVEKLTNTSVSVRFVDLESYLKLGYVPKQVPADLSTTSAGQMVNPLKTLTVDPKHIYLAVTPAVSDSTLIHQMAHALDYLGGSRLNPGMAGPLSMELELPSELLEHPREFGGWLEFLRNEFAVNLDAEDTIVAFLYEKGYLIPGDVIASGDRERLEAMARRCIDYMRVSRNEIDERIRGREGYLEDRE